MFEANGRFLDGANRKGTYEVTERFSRKANDHPERTYWEDIEE
ncbi:hypothetical protein LEP1GSC021_4565 [Leptospira noguchii str. 1993005606]|nr:hypothetical protein LEP1GSC021_4565 [Leptospira noguchii str. 1993005606]